MKLLVFINTKIVERMKQKMFHLLYLKKWDMRKKFCAIVMDIINGLIIIHIMIIIIIDIII